MHSQNYGKRISLQNYLLLRCVQLGQKIKIRGKAEWRQALTKNVNLVKKKKKGEGKNKGRILKGNMLKYKSWHWRAV